MYKFSLLFVLFIAFIANKTIAQNEQMKLEELEDVKVTGIKLTDSIIYEADLPQRYAVFENKKVDIIDNMIFFCETLKSPKEKCLTSTGYLKPSLLNTYSNTKKTAKAFSVAVENEINLAINSCECISKSRLQYISNLQKLQNTIEKQTSKVESLVVKKVKGV
ncbi:MAG: hypothetical protein IPO21_12275 [Bacteroidales bacterium]|nr:hypothetical protein [Bacteroidales bacterium]